MLKNYRRGLMSYKDLCVQVARLVKNSDHVWTEDELQTKSYVGDDYLPYMRTSGVTLDED